MKISSFIIFVSMALAFFVLPHMAGAGAADRTAAGLDSSTFQAGGSSLSDTDVVGKYKAVAPEGGIGWITVSRLHSGELNVDITAAGSNPVKDCHFNLDASLNGNRAEYTGKNNKECWIRVEFQGDGLNLSSSNACSDPLAAKDYVAGCEQGASLIKGTYQKVSNDPQTSP